MKILIIGSGGREHAFAWKLTQSPRCEKLFIAPGNAGTASYGTNVNISTTDFEGIAALCLREKIGMVVVGPEEPLVKGITDFLKKNAATAHLHVIGPSGQAAQLEGSKAFAKEFMRRHNIPTAAYAEFTEENYEAGVEYIKNHALPIVLKADGLAAGKGVLICQNHIEALSEFELMILRSKFGEAGKKVVIEEFLEGIELSVFVVTDGKHHVTLPAAKDYKRVGEGDTGLNTGGMGAVSPLPFVTAEFMQKVETQIINPTINGLTADRLDYCGFIFLGLISVNGDPKVIEYNCRMGDPETEAVLPRVKNDWVELLLATSQQRINEIELLIDERATATVVAVSGGYPGDFKKGLPILGLDEPQPDDVMVFQAGTREEPDAVVTNGGRVLAVTAYGSNITDAVERSLAALQELHFEGIYYRTDIGYEFS